MELTLAADRSRKAVIVHGGSAAHVYRDVLQARDLALAVQADGFEFDVRRTADGVLVVHHEEAIGEQPLATLTFDRAASLAETAGYELPRLSTVIDPLRGRLSLDVELKESGYEAQVVEALLAAGFGDEAVICTSFEQAALDGIRKARPSMRTGLLVWDCTWEQAVQLFRASGTQLLGPDHAILSPDVLAAAERERIPLVPWTVNDADWLERLFNASAVAGVITDRPQSAITARATAKPE